MSHDDRMNGLPKHDMMIKNKVCMKMMKMHPDMMSDGGMMKH